MNNLSIYIENKKGEQTINGRNLYKKLEIKKDYTNWVKQQIKRGELEENKDYLVFAFEGENPLGGRPIKEYFFTIQTANNIVTMSHAPKKNEVINQLIEALDQQLKNTQNVLREQEFINIKIKSTNKLIKKYFNNSKKIKLLESNQETMADDIARMSLVLYKENLADINSITSNDICRHMSRLNRYYSKLKNINLGEGEKIFGRLIFERFKINVSTRAKNNNMTVISYIRNFFSYSKQVECLNLMRKIVRDTEHLYGEDTIFKVEAK